MRSCMKATLTSCEAFEVFTFPNWFRSPRTSTFLALMIAGSACAMDTCEASSMITRSNISRSSGMNSA